jgi:hypothetical protein
MGPQPKLGTRLYLIYASLHNKGLITHDTFDKFKSTNHMSFVTLIELINKDTNDVETKYFFQTLTSKYNTFYERDLHKKLGSGILGKHSYIYKIRGCMEKDTFASLDKLDITIDFLTKKKFNKVAFADSFNCWSCNDIEDFETGVLYELGYDVKQHYVERAVSDLLNCKNNNNN